MQSHQGRSIRCIQCGGPFEITVLVNSVRCPYCHRDQSLGPELVRELAAYEREVAQHLERAQAHANQVQALDQWKSRSPLSILLPLVCMAVATVATFVALLVAAEVGWIGTPGWQPFLGVSAVLGPVLGVGLWALIQVPKVLLGRQQNAQVALRVVKVSCPNCGAPGALTPGDSLDSCQSCRAALAPGTTAMFAAVSDASRQRRALRIERYKKERAEQGAMVPIQDMSSWMLYGILAFNVCAPLMIFLGAGFEALLKPDFDEYGALSFAGVWFVVGLTGSIGFLLWRLNRRARVRSTMADLAQQFRGNWSSDWLRVTRWLDAYWAGPYPLADRQVGYYYATLECTVNGYPVLVEVNLSQSKSERARVSVRVATAEPDPSVPRRREADTEAAWLVHLGFALDESEAGLTAEATREVLKQARANPERIHAVAPALNHLTRLAFYRGRGPGELLR